MAKRKSWSDQIRDDILWCKIYIMRHEKKAIRTIDRYYKIAADSIKALLENDRRRNQIADRHIAARVFVFHHMRPMLKELATMVHSVTARRMKLAANNMRATLYSAFHMKEHPYIVVSEAAAYETPTVPDYEPEPPPLDLEDILGYQQVPEVTYAEMLTADVMGATLDAWAASLSSKALDTMVKEYVAGQAVGESIDAIARRLKRELGYTQHRARMMARTAIQTAANNMQERAYKANERFLKGHKFNATLDVRTCETCGGLDGNTYRTGESRPRLLLHPG